MKSLDVEIESEGFAFASFFTAQSGDEQTIFRNIEVIMNFDF